MSDKVVLNIDVLAALGKLGVIGQCHGRKVVLVDGRWLPRSVSEFLEELSNPHDLAGGLREANILGLCRRLGDDRLTLGAPRDCAPTKHHYQTAGRAACLDAVRIGGIRIGVKCPKPIKSATDHEPILTRRFHISQKMADRLDVLHAEGGCET